MWIAVFVLGAALADPVTPPPPPSSPVVAGEVADLPPELAGWAPWVLSRHPALTCPLLGDARTCAWPGVFALSAGPDGATARLAVTVDRAVALPIPGGRGSWPQDLRVDGRPAPVADLGGVPAVPLDPGGHVLTWSTPWDTAPQAIPLPPSVGLVALTLDGVPVAEPSLRDGVLRLGAGDTTERTADQLTLEVGRLITDAVPLQVRTRVDLSVAGGAREMDLGAVGLAGTVPVALSADLPARLDADGHLIVQVRPGSFTITIDALHEGPVASLTAPQLAEPWPDTETWAVATDDRVRAVNLSGPPGVDPARTTLPPEWSGHPTFRVQPSTPLQIEELRRGEPEAAPNRLALDRTLWLDQDGRGFTVQDSFSGTVNQGWRLDVQAPSVLGHASDHDTDQVITERDGRVGVETRSQDVRLVAESRIDARPSALPAVGWHTDVVSLGAGLHLPPGWRLLAATGVDKVHGTDPWSLFDLFFVLVVALALGRLLGWRWGLVTLAALGLSRHEAGAPAWTFAWLAVTVALLQVLPVGRLRTAVSGLRWGLLLALFAILAPFSVDHVQTGLFPALERTWNSGADTTMQEIPDRFVELVVPEAGKLARGIGSSGSLSYLSAQQDPAAVVQTGPGVPSWSWTAIRLDWSGPVDADHTVRLWLLGPRMLLVLALARVALLLLLAIKLTDARRLGRALVPIALAVALIGPTAAQATPSAEQLADLEARLTAPPACAPDCASASTVALTVTDDRLTVVAEVHALAQTAWPLPGPTSTWVPAEVRVGGVVHTALARRPDGALWVRLSPGVHTLRAEGPLPATDALPLQFAQRPHRITWASDSWTVEGLKADGTVEGTIQLVRASPTGGESASSDNLRPWLEVTRRVDLGLPWRVATTVRRVGPTQAPIALRIPLIPGESVTDGTWEVREGALVVTLDRDVSEVTWMSTLAEADTLTLRAPSDVPWTEEWRVTCSPMHACEAADGPPPLAHVTDGTWSPYWRPWPDEAVTLNIGRPPAVTGQTVTVDRAELEWTPGRRLGEATLTLEVRSSQGGRRVLTLPAGAKLQQVRIDARDRPVRLADDGTLALPLRPGAQSFEVAWQQPHAPAIWDQVPPVDLGGSAVNTTVTVNAPEGRIVLALFGPIRGPTPLFWTTLLLVCAAAPLLARVPWTPLGVVQWGLLGLGMTQVPVVVPLLLVLSFMALGLRQRRQPAGWLAFNLAQVGLALLVLASLVGLYAAIHAGLLLQPDMQVQGNGSSDRTLSWFVDRTAGPLAQPVWVTVPVWTFRVAMLLWSLWLAASLVRWAPWAWSCWTTNGWWRARVVTEAE